MAGYERDLREVRQDLREHRKEAKQGFDNLHRTLIQTTVAVLTAFVVGFGALIGLVATQPAGTRVRSAGNGCRRDACLFNSRMSIPQASPYVFFARRKPVFFVGVEHYIVLVMNDVSTIHRTTIEIEVPAFEEAREALGTKGYKETVNEALRAVSRREQLRHRADERIRSGALGLTTPEELEELRKPRY